MPVADDLEFWSTRTLDPTGAIVPRPRPVPVDLMQRLFTNGGAETLGLPSTFLSWVKSHPQLPRDFDVTEPRYQRLIGADNVAGLLSKYDGVVSAPDRAAVAAYHAGHQSVDEAIKAAGDGWEEHLFADGTRSKMKADLDAVLSPTLVAAETSKKPTTFSRPLQAERGWSDWLTDEKFKVWEKRFGDRARDQVQEINRFIDETATKYKIRPEIFRRLIRVESVGGDPDARGGKGEIGLTQLMPDTVKQLGIKNPYDPKENIDGGARWLAAALRKNKEDEAKALIAYNGSSSYLRHFIDLLVAPATAGAKAAGPVADVLREPRLGPAVAQAAKPRPAQSEDAWRIIPSTDIRSPYPPLPKVPEGHPIHDVLLGVERRAITELFPDIPPIKWQQEIRDDEVRAAQLDVRMRELYWPPPALPPVARGIAGLEAAPTQAPPLASLGGRPTPPGPEVLPAMGGRTAPEVEPPPALPMPPRVAAAPGAPPVAPSPLPALGMRGRPITPDAATALVPPATTSMIPSASDVRANPLVSSIAPRPAQLGEPSGKPVARGTIVAPAPAQPSIAGKLAQGVTPSVAQVAEAAPPRQVERAMDAATMQGEPPSVTAPVGQPTSPAVTDEEREFLRAIRAGDQGQGAEAPTTDEEKEFLRAIRELGGPRESREAIQKRFSEEAKGFGAEQTWLEQEAGAIKKDYDGLLKFLGRPLPPNEYAQATALQTEFEARRQQYESRRVEYNLKINDYNRRFREATEPVIRADTGPPRQEVVGERALATVRNWLTALGIPQFLQRGMDIFGLPVPEQDAEERRHQQEGAKAVVEIMGGPMPKAPLEEVPGQALLGIAKIFTWGFAPLLARAYGIDIPRPTTVAGEYAEGLGEVLGFLVGPGIPAGKLAVEATVGRWLNPVLTDARQVAMAKMIAREAATLATASAITETGTALEQPTLGKAAVEMGQAAKNGAIFGAVFGGAKGILPENTLRQVSARIGLGLAAIDAARGTRPWDDRTISQKAFDYGLNAYFLFHGQKVEDVVGEVQENARRWSITEDEAFQRSVAEMAEARVGPKGFARVQRAYERQGLTPEDARLRAVRAVLGATDLGTKYEQAYQGRVEEFRRQGMSDEDAKSHAIEIMVFGTSGEAPGKAAPGAPPTPGAPAEPTAKPPAAGPAAPTGEPAKPVIPSPADVGRGKRPQPVRPAPAPPASVAPAPEAAAQPPAAAPPRPVEAPSVPALAPPIATVPVAPPAPATAPPEPPVAPGFVRLYRGEGIDPVALPEWAKAQAGQWFSTSREKAESFQKQRSGRLRYVDIPESQVEQYNLYAEQGRAGVGDEYLIPDIVQRNRGAGVLVEPQAQPVTPASPVAPPSRVTEAERQFEEGWRKAEEAATRLEEAAAQKPHEGVATPQVPGRPPVEPETEPQPQPRSDDEEHDYSSTQVDLPDRLATKVRTFAAGLSNDVLAEGGREEHPHVTLKYGLHTASVAPVQKLLAGEPPVTVKLGPLGVFKQPDADVLYVSVESPDLDRLNAKVAAMLPNTETQAEYKPHVTIAYLKPGEGDKYVGNRALAGEEATLSQVTFSSKKGTVATIVLGGTAQPTPAVVLPPALQPEPKPAPVVPPAVQPAPPEALAATPTGPRPGLTMGERVEVTSGRHQGRQGVAERVTRGGNVSVRLDDGKTALMPLTTVKSLLEPTGATPPVATRAPQQAPIRWVPKPATQLPQLASQAQAERIAGAAANLLNALKSNFGGKWIYGPAGREIPRADLEPEIKRFRQELRNAGIRRVPKGSNLEPEAKRWVTQGPAPVTVQPEPAIAPSAAEVPVTARPAGVPVAQPEAAAPVPPAQPPATDTVRSPEDVYRTGQARAAELYETPREYDRVLAGVSEVLNGHIDDPDQARKAILEIANRWHDPLVSLSSSATLEQIGKAMDGKLLGDAQARPSYDAERVLGQQIPGLRRSDVVETRNQASRAADDLEQEFGRDRERGSLAKVRPIPEGYLLRAADVETILGTETDGVRLAREKANRYRDAAEKYDQAMRDRLAELREQAKAPVPAEVLARLDNPTPADQLAVRIIGELTTKTIDKMVERVDLVGPEGPTEGIKLLGEWADLSQKARAFIAPLDPATLFEALQIVRSEDGVVRKYSPRPRELRASDVEEDAKFGQDPRSGKTAKAYAAVEQGRRVWGIHYLAEYGDVPKAFPVGTWAPAAEMSKYIPAVPPGLKPAEPIARAWKNDLDVVYLRLPDGQLSTVNSLYWDHFTARHPQAQAFQTDPAKPLVFKEVETVLGVLMPMRVGTAPPAVTALADRISGNVSFMATPSEQEVAPPFFSALQRAIEERMPERASAEQVRAILRGPGVKAEEVKWTGIEDFLEGKTTVSRSEVLDFLRQNEVRVEEVVKGRSEQADLDRAEREFAEVARHDRRGLPDRYWGATGILDLSLEVGRGEMAVESLPDRLLKVGQRLRNAYLGRSEAPEEQTKFERFILPGGPLSRDMEILTAVGWRRMDEVSVGDVVLTRRDNDAVLEWQPVEDVPKVWAESLLRFKSVSVDMRVTDQHQMVVWNNYAKGIQRITAKQLFQHPHDKRIPLCGNGVPDSGKTLYGLDARDVGELIGWYISEGSKSSPGRGRGKTALKIPQCPVANPEKCRRIESLLDRLGIRWCKSGISYQLGIRTMPPELVSLLRTQGTAYHKHIPQVLFSATRRVLEGLVDGLLLGDGTTVSRGDNKKPQTRFYTSSRQLADDFQIALILTGANGTVRPIPRKEFPDRPMFQVVVKHGKWSRPSCAQRTVEAYNDWAFCVTVRNHAVCVRSNGIAGFTGNSDYRELLLTLPEPRDRRLGEPARVVSGEHGWEVYDDKDQPYGMYYAASEADALAQAKRQGPTDFGLAPLRSGETARTRELAADLTAASNAIADYVRVHPGAAPVRDAQLAELVRRRDNVATQLSLAREAAVAARPQTYRSPHWDEPNVLAHVRFNDRVDAEGKRVLFIEELQSDWHQKGRQYGYKAGANLIEGHDYDWWRERTDELFQRVHETPLADRNRTLIEGEWGQAAENRNLLRESSLHAVPDAPFAKTWHELVMKRMLRFSAEHGYDKLAFTTGAQQADRYDLSKHVDRVEYNSGAQTLYAFKGRERVIAKNDVKDSDLPGIIGKEAADRLLANKEWDNAQGGSTYILEGEQLRVGGLGMMGFYDQILPAFLNRYGKRWGARVGETKIHADKEAPYAVVPMGEMWGIQDRNGVLIDQLATRVRADTAAGDLNKKAVNESVHSIDITPAMRDSVLREGQPLFMGRGKFPSTDSVVEALWFAPHVPGTPHQRVADTTGLLRPSRLQAIAESAHVKALAPALDDAYRQLADRLALDNAKYADSFFFGLGVDPTYYGLNHRRATFVSAVLANAHAIARTVNSFVVAGAIDETERPREAARLLVNVLLHEATHQEVRGHADPDTDFAEVYARNLDTTEELRSQLVDAVAGVLGGPDAHYESFLAEAGQLQAERAAAQRAGGTPANAPDRAATLGGEGGAPPSEPAGARPEGDLGRGAPGEVSGMATGPELGRGGPEPIAVVESPPRDLEREGWRRMPGGLVFPLEVAKATAESRRGPGTEFVVQRVSPRLGVVWERPVSEAVPAPSPPVEAGGGAAPPPGPPAPPGGGEPPEGPGEPGPDPAGEDPGPAPEPEPERQQVHTEGERRAFFEDEAQRIAERIRARGDEATVRPAPGTKGQQMVVWRPGRGDAIRKWLAPASRGPVAQMTAAQLRAMEGRLVREDEMARWALRKAAHDLDRLASDEQRVAFIDYIEHGRISDLPEWFEGANLRPIAQTLRDMFDQDREDVQALGTGALESFILDYFPHIWERPDDVIGALGRYYGKRPLEGPKSFLKRRTIPTTADGMAAGLEPVSTNPITLALLKHREMRKYIAGQQFFQDMKDRKVARFVRESAVQDAKGQGLAEIDDRIARVRQYSQEERGFVERGKWMMPEEGALVLNNYLRPGWYGRNGLFDAYRGFGNLMNMVQLGFSAFHVGFVTLDTQISAVALGLQEAGLGLEQLAKGEGARAGQNLATGGLRILLSPTAPIRSLLSTGPKAIREYYKPGSEGELMQGLVDRWVEGGGRARMDRWYSTDAMNQFGEAWRQKDAVGMAKWGLPAFIESFSWPIFQYVVPKMKAAVAMDMIRFEMENMPADATGDELRAVWDAITDSVDDRLGQLTYTNLFWDRRMKDGLMATVRTVGWNLGTYRTGLGGAVVDLPKMLGYEAAAVHRALTGVAPEIREGARRQYVNDIRSASPLPRRLAYLIALPLVNAIWSTLYEWWMTGAPPDQPFDFVAPRTGRTRPDGSADRKFLPTYMKDAVAYSADLVLGHPLRTLLAKIHPELQLLSDEFSNKDFAGGPIRNAKDNVVERLADSLDYAISYFEPYGVAAYQRARREGATPAEAAQGFVGVVPAPSYATRSFGQSRVKEARREQIPPDWYRKKRLENQPRPLRHYVERWEKLLRE